MTGTADELTDPHSITAETEFTVEFYDVDSMEVVWHGNYVKYFEKARCALLNKIGYGYEAMKESGFAFPVTGIDLKFIRPLRFGERVRARALLDEYENRLRIKYELYNAATGELTTRGTSTQMAVDMAKRESCFESPRILLDRVRALLREGGR
ncbi:MAG: acyl-CoA thioesterase [Treponema sp.]|jgi:acyl-CoA thioester hydrolase|nr:acyl-CoA thioesterase [Treponema sp.]